MRFHNEPKHSCVHCNKKFYTSTHLKRHMKYHFEPAYACAKCGKNFIHPEIWKSIKKEKQDVSCNFDRLVFNKFEILSNLKILVEIN